jgi:Uma2 family endonuclease
MNIAPAQRLNALPEPAWDIARRFPAQGAWSEEEYLALPGNALVELDHGHIEVLDMPSEWHQSLVLALYELLASHARKHRLGKVLTAPMPVKLWEGKLREPDVLFMRREHAALRGENYWRGADLVMEVLSPNDPNRDKVTKRREYAQAGIPEYWLVDPSACAITVFSLPENAEEYAIHGVWGIGGQARSASLEGFQVDVEALFTPEE